MNFFISNSRLVILVSLSLIVMGIKGLLNLQRQAIPPVDFATAIITTTYPGSSPTEVEELITTKIEDEIRSVRHLRDINSISKPGLSIITIRIKIDQTNTLEVINELHQALQNVQGLPPEVLDPPRLIHIDSSTRRAVINLLVTGPDHYRRRDQISWNLKTKLEKIPGVAEIELTNYKKREFLVLLSQEKMRKNYISSTDIISALEQKKMDVPAGYLETNTNRTLVRVTGKIRTVKDLENTIIRSNFSGEKVFIKDVATVIDDHEKETQRQYFHKPNKNQHYHLTPATSLSIIKTAKGDIINVISHIQKTVKKFSQNLNEEYNILTGFNDGENTQNRLKNVINNALAGLVIIFIVFFLFLPSRVGFMVSWSLPLSLFGTFAVLPFIGVSFNVITMLAFVICIGMLIDNSVVIAEYYSRLTIEDKKAPLTAALESIHQFVKPITATVLTTIVAFLPLLVTTGVMGQFVKWIPIVVTLALLMSLFESFYLLPNRLMWLSQKKPSPYQIGILNKLSYVEKLFEKLIKNVVTRKYISLSIISAIILSTILVFMFASRLDLFAPKSPEFYTALIEPQPNTPLDLIDQKAKKIAEEMQSVFKDKKQIDWMNVKSDTEKAEILLRVKPTIRRKLNYKNILNQLRKIEKGDLKTLRFSTVVGGPPVGKPLSVAIQSNNRKQIREFMSAIFPEIEKIPGLISLKSNPDTDQGVEYRVKLHTEVLARLGVSFSSVGTALRTALEGHIITELTENNESFYIRIKHDDTKISSSENLKGIKIKTISGQLISLNKVAEVKVVPSEPHRKSYNFEPVVFLEADINPKITTSLQVNIKAKKIIEQKIKDYPSLTFKMLGEQETTAESLNSLLNAAIIAVFAIFIILIVLFKSFLLSFLILTCIPLGLIGVIWAFFFHQRPLDFFAMIGIIALAGVVVNSAIILVSFILKIKKEEPESSLSEVVIKASKMRFRPIMITNLTTLGGLFPTAYAISGFEPLLIPMTLALFWGLLTATLLTLIWIPCAMLIMEDGKYWIAILKNKFKKKHIAPSI